MSANRTSADSTSWLTFAAWILVVVAAIIIAAIGSFENIPFVYEGL